MNKLEIENKLKDNKFPEGWTKNIIANLFFLGRGRVISEKEIVNNEGTYSVFSSQTSNKGELGKITSYDFEGEYITWTTDGANAGTVFYRSGRFNCTNVCGTLKARSENIYVKFFAYLLSTQAKKYVSYIGNPKLMNNTVAKILLFFPSFLPEQQKIAEILETVDETIEKTDAVIEKYKRIKRGLMQNLLTKGIDKKGEIRSEKTHKFKDSPLGRIPEEWEVVELGVVGSIVSGSTPSTNKAEFWNGNIVWITPDDLSKLENKYICTSSRKISKKGLQRCSAKMIPKNSIVISSRAPIGYLAISKVDMATNQGCKSIVLKNLFDVEFIYYCLHLYITKMIMLGSGTTFSEISKTELNKLKIVIPKFKEEQQCITSILFQIDETVEKEQNYKEKLERIKQGLMEDLLTGKVRVLNVN